MPTPAPPGVPPESALNGATFAASEFVSAPVKPAAAPETKVVALLMTGPMLPVAARIFCDTKLLINCDVADCLGSIPKAAFLARFESSSIVSALVFASIRESSF